MDFLNTLNSIKKIKRLAKQHRKQAENSCNGIGYVKGKRYYSGSINDWSKKQYGDNIKTSHIDDNMDVFLLEQESIEKKIDALIPSGFKAEYQGDPRGATVRLFDPSGKDITSLIC